jgi:betaine-aldehyde dehydrogenase
MNTNTSPQAILPTHLDCFYGSAWHSPLSGKRVDTRSPGTGELLASVADASAADVDAAVSAAKTAFSSWRLTAPRERGNLLRRCAQVLRDHADDLARLDAADCGNPVAEMKRDVLIAADGIEYFAGLAAETKGETIPVGHSFLNYSTREPLGVVARIVAYNHPLMFAAVKIGAPLAAGNVVIVKPSEQAPLSALRMAELFADILPHGVLSVLPGGRECGEALTCHRDIAKVTLIGSVATGQAIAKAASTGLKPLLLELGGKNALVVYPDADLDKAADGIVRGMNFTWAGQSCGSTSRVFLHTSIHDQVLQAVAERTALRHKPGLPTDYATTMGPLVSKAQQDKVLRYIAIAKAEGARLVLGGKVPVDPALANGYFVEPTIFADVLPSMRIAREEVFGPVLSVLKWSDEVQMLRDVNDVEYGLSASIWTRDLVTAHRAAQSIEAGYIWVNNSSQHFLGAPFGGYKLSGLGREECVEELLSFTKTKNINVKLD